MDPMTMMLISQIAPLLFSGMGKDAKTGSTYSPGQQTNLEQFNKQIQGMQGQVGDITQNQNYQTGQDWLQSMFSDPDFFDKFEAPMQRQFNEQTVPDLANRFASQGSGGSLGSTGFRNQLAREGSNLSTNMAAQRGQMQQNAIPQLMQYAQQPFSNMMSMYNQALSPQPNNQYFPATPGAASQGLASFSGGYLNALGQNQGEQLAKSWNTGQSPSTV